MQEKIIEISKKYNLITMLENINALDKNLDLKIGFLGEFSSGKSTLINALLNKKVLPSMDKPTSKSVIELVAKDNLEELEFYELRDNRKERISATEFSKIALEKSDSNGVVHVPSNEFFQDGYMMIDTPGISSLDESDIDITYGYLPFLDCAVVCNHIQKGSLTQSIINFLLKSEIKPIINNILFVITNAHSKAPDAQKRIREEVIAQLNSLNEKHSLGIEDIDLKVIIVSALEAMEGKDGFSLDEIKERFNDIFISKKILLQEEKRAKGLEKITEQLLETLLFKKENSNLDLSNIREKERQFSDEIAMVEQKKFKIIKSLESIDIKIQERIYSTFYKYLPRIKSLKDVDETNNLVKDLQDVISRDISKIVSIHFEELSTPTDNNIQFTELETIIQNLLKQINMGKDIGMVILIELLTLGTAGVAGVFGFFLRSTSRMIINQKGDSHLKDTANFINQVNPLEIVGDMFGSDFIEKQIVPKLEKLSKDISRDIIEELEEKIESEIFAPLEDKLVSNQEMLNQLYKEKSDKIEKFTTLHKQIDDDILELKLIRRG
jgi:GTPase SAR1 family protein